MLSTRDPSQNKRYTQTKSEGWKKIFNENGKEKKGWGSNTFLAQNRL